MMSSTRHSLRPCEVTIGCGSANSQEENSVLSFVWYGLSLEESKVGKMFRELGSSSV